MRPQIDGSRIGNVGVKQTKCLFSLCQAGINSNKKRHIASGVIKNEIILDWDLRDPLQSAP